VVVVVVSGRMEDPIEFGAIVIPPLLSALDLASLLKFSLAQSSCLKQQCVMSLVVNQHGITKIYSLTIKPYYYYYYYYLLSEIPLESFPLSYTLGDEVQHYPEAIHLETVS
jgi:hypothetical protein